MLLQEEQQRHPRGSPFDFGEIARRRRQRSNPPANVEPLRWRATRGWASPTLALTAPPTYPLGPAHLSQYEVPFAFDAKQFPIETAVYLRPAEPPSVHLSSGRRIGEIGTQIRHLLLLRLEDGHAMAGFLEKIDPRGETGMLRITCLSPTASPESGG